MRSYLVAWLMMLAVMVFSGCSVKYTSVDFGQEADSSNGVASKDTPGEGGRSVNVLVIKADGSSLETETNQDATGELAAGMEGAQAAVGAIKDSMAKYAPDLSKKNSDNPTTTTTTTNIEENAAEQVSPGTEEVSEDIDYKNKATYTSYGVRNGGRQAWRIPGNGPSFGNTIKFVFSSGKTYLVKDTSKNCRGDNPDTCGIPSSSNKDGFVFKPGLGPNGEGDSDTGTSHKGVYLHAPYGDSSKTVTLYFNKP